MLGAEEPPLVKPGPLGPADEVEDTGVDEAVEDEPPGLPGVPEVPELSGLPGVADDEPALGKDVSILVALDPLDEGLDDPEPEAELELEPVGGCDPLEGCDPDPEPEEDDWLDSDSDSGGGCEPDGGVEPEDGGGVLLDPHEPQSDGPT